LTKVWKPKLYDTCEPIILQLSLKQDPVCPPHGLIFNIKVVDNKTSLAIPEATVQLIQTSSILGASQDQVGSLLYTNTTGMVSSTLQSNGTYRVSVSAPGYQDLSQEVSLPESICEDGSLSLTLNLAKEPPIECTDNDKTAIDITVIDIYTGVPVPGVFVDITYVNKTTIPVGPGLRTDDNGEIRLPVAKLGQYVAAINKTSLSPLGPYQPATNMTNLTCCTCPASIYLYLDQISCDSLLNITVRDNITGLERAGARVTLYLTDSVTGPSMQMIENVKITDGSGLVQYIAPINGNYSVTVDLEKYLPKEYAFDLDCDPLNGCECDRDIEVDLEEDFCKNKTYKMMVVDSTNNVIMEGAKVNMIQETHHGPNDLGIFTVDATGEVVLPILGNGHYTIYISMEGYMNLTTTLFVAVTPEECEFLAPFDLVPLKKPTPGCVEISLTWGEDPQDLDLFSYRVHEFVTDDQCETFYCDGKDPCSGIKFLNDTKTGGNTGTETITYCGVDDYSNMVWVDDRSGLGASLIDSEAKLIITSDEKTQEVTLRPAEGQQPGDRYWLAGCLTTNSRYNTFDFLVLNQFTTGKPDIEQPLHCHSRTTLDNNPSTPRANIHVSVSTSQGAPLSGAMVSLSTVMETYSRTTEEDGQLVLPVTEEGPFSLIAQLDGYVPERLNFSLYCNDVEFECETRVAVTMISLEEDGGLRIKLNWEGEESRDLDIHLVQVASEEPRELCQTYWNNMAGCSDTELDQNLGVDQGGNQDNFEILDSKAETITVANLAAKQNLKFLVFVDDNTATGADLSQVKPQLTITQGNKVVGAQMPVLPPSEAGSRFWTVGAIETSGSSFRFVKASSWSIESPWTKSAILVDNILAGNTNVETDIFCQGIKLNVAVIDALTHQRQAGGTVSITRLSEDDEQVITTSAAIDAQGELKVPISEAGHYEVHVEGAGYISARQSMFVECHPADCAVCSPSVTVPLSPALAANQLRLTLGGEKNLKDLELYATLRDDSVSCVTTPDQLTDCDGVDLVTGAGDQGVQTITFNQPSDENPAVYTLFARWNAPAGQDKKVLSDMKAWMSLSNGTIMEEIDMDMSEYGGEKHWFAGCLLLSGTDKDSGYQLRPLNIFLSERPDEEMADYCLETFGLQPRGIEWEGQCTIDNPSRVLSVNFGNSKYNTPAYCTAKCRSHKYKYAGVQYTTECFCGNTPPDADLIVADKECSRTCPGDSKKICGGTWRQNVYATGYEDGAPFPPGHSCDCSYTLGGCKISRAPPAGYACKCKYKGWWSCKGSLRLCGQKEECPAKCKSKTCCKKGQGDCGGYWW